MQVKEHPETGVYVKDLSAFVVRSVEDMEMAMTKGNSLRMSSFLRSCPYLFMMCTWRTGKVGETQMNRNSSRSHAIFTILIERSEKVVHSVHMSLFVLLLFNPVSALFKRVLICACAG